MEDKLAPLRYSYTSKFVSKHIPYGSRLLDIGIGWGDVFYHQLKGKYDVVGLDKQATSVVSYILDIEKDDLKKIGEKFRFVTMFDVIEHLENPIAALRNIRNILEKNGLFIGSTPNRFDPYLFLGAHINPDHNYVFDKQTMKHLLTKCRFKVIQIKSRVLPVILPKRRYISVDISKLIPTGRIVFWVATPDDS